MDSYEDWILVGNSYFSKRVLYSLEWSRSSRGSPGINLEYMRTSCCPFGGPIAIWRDESKVMLQLGAFSRPDIQIFSASGHPLGRVLWQGGRILTAGWTTTEELIVVNDSGKVYRFTSTGQAAATEPSVFSLGTACEREGIAEVDVFPNGVVVRTAGSGDVYYVEDCIADPRPRKLPDSITRSVFGANRIVHCIASVPPSLSASGSLQLIVAVGSSMYIVDEQDVIVTGIEEGPFVKVVVSPDGCFVVGYAADDVMYVWSYSNGDELTMVARVFLPDTENYQHQQSSWNTTTNDTNDTNDSDDDIQQQQYYNNMVLPSGAPDHLSWCGTDAVLAVWHGTGTLLISLLHDNNTNSDNSNDNTNNTSVEISYTWMDIGRDGAIAAISERDSIRLIDSYQHVLLRKVPPSLVDALEIGSTSPAALLYDARRLYDERDARAAACLLDLLNAGTLAEAVAVCLDAAAMEMDVLKQEALMKAGCYGRAFLVLQDNNNNTSNDNNTTTSMDNTNNNTSIATTARTLRVINALMYPSIAMPLTMNQFNYLGIYHIISRLTTRHHYLLALRICEALGVSTDTVLVRWACDKISASASSMPDAELLSALSSKLDGHHGVHWAHIAAHARSQGRTRLAASLAEREINASDQIPLLMSLNEEDRALEKALHSVDPDLIFYVLYSVWRKVDRSGGQMTSAAASMPRQFWSAMAKSATARSLFASFLDGSSTSGGGSGGGGDNSGRSIIAHAIHDHQEIAIQHVRNAITAMSMSSSTQSSQQHNQNIIKEWSKAKDAFIQSEKHNAATTKDDSKFESAAATAAIRLLEVQSELQSSTGRDCFVGLSVVDTVKQCLRLGMREKAQKVAKEFKVPEKQQMLLAINAAAAQQDWSALQQMAGRLDRRSPVTMEHFVAAARSGNAPAATVRWFIDRMTGDGALMRRAELYAEIGLMREAQMLADQAELTGGGGSGGGGVLGSLRDAVGGRVGSFMGNG